MRFTIAGLTALCLAAGLPAPPPTRVDIVIDRMHGAEIADPYRWLEDQQSPETRSWIAKQNEYSRAVFEAVPGRDRLRGHLESFFAGEAARAPYARGDRYFYTRRTGDRDRDRVSIVTRKGVDGPERTLVDPATLTSDPDTTVSVMDVSPDGQLLAYATRKGGEDEREVSFLEPDSGRVLPDRLPRGAYENAFILADNRGFLYSRRRAEGTQVLEHRFGTPFSEDRELFGETVPKD